jgi:hypothetical protein
MDKRVGEEAPYIARFSRGEPRNTDVARHILPTSGTMIAMCTTMVGLVKVAEGRLGATSVDVYAALLGAAFLTCAIMAYLSMRLAHIDDISRRLERAADTTFLVSLCAAVAMVVLFALEAI